jgi:hypothetical protein
MSSSIKDIIKTFKNLNEKEEAPSVEEVTIPSPKPKAEKPKKTTAVSKPKKVVSTTIVQNTVETSTAKISLNDAFFASLADQEFNYEDRKIAYLESDLYEIFMSVKRKKRIKNVSVLINAILNQFVEENREDLKAILANTKL